MGKTYRQQGSKFDDDRRQGRRGKHHTHANNRKTHGMKILNPDEDFSDDEFNINDLADINKNSEHL